MTGSRIQWIVGSVLCMHQWCAVIDPAVRSTPQSSHSILLLSLTQYESPTPVHFSYLASFDIPYRIIMGWHVIVRELTTFSERP